MRRRFNAYRARPIWQQALAEGTTGFAVLLGIFLAQGFGSGIGLGLVLAIAVYGGMRLAVQRALLRPRRRLPRLERLDKRDG
jgi:hypothetical protein